VAHIYDLPSFIGRQFSRLMVIDIAPPGPRGRSMCLCRCTCGITKVVSLKNLLSGKTQSCGCLFMEKRESRHREAAAKVMATGIKRCSKCKEMKLLSAFGPRSVSVYLGLCSWCFDCWRDNHLRRKFGISLEEVRELIRSQDGMCAVKGCETLVDTGSPVDHCHESGRIRGILCTPCNVSIGMLGEDPRRIAGLAEYVRQWQQLLLSVRATTLNDSTTPVTLNRALDDGGSTNAELCTEPLDTGGR